MLYCKDKNGNIFFNYLVYLGDELTLKLILTNQHQNILTLIFDKILSTPNEMPQCDLLDWWKEDKINRIKFFITLIIHSLLLLEKISTQNVNFKYLKTRDEMIIRVAGGSR